mmetsp:Transcript_129300/g.322314  ORF Transcript_129300/g.322314 Transcript_129300/m.322314 type:complete len:456 (+) Transcript_129300:150-1517(+)
MYPSSDRALGEGFAFRPAAQRPSTATGLRSADGPREGPSSAADSAGIDRGYGGEGVKRRSPLTPRNVLILLGTLILLLIIVAPLWDATRLLDDPSFVFFVGRSLPIWIVVICLAAVSFYVVTMLMYFWRATSDFQHEQALVMINVVVISALGLSFLGLSQPLITESSAISQDLFMSCQQNVYTHEVAAYAASLQSLRQSPACALRPSVEQCAGFESRQPMLGFLKSLESRSHCAGFCMGVARSGNEATAESTMSDSNATNSNATGSPAVSAAPGGDEATSQDAMSDGNPTGSNTSHPALVARGVKPQQLGRQVQLTSEGFDFAKLAAPHKGLASALLRFAQSSLPMQANTGSDSVTGGVTMMLTQKLNHKGQTHDDGGVRARTLFSRDEHKTSCEGTAARALMVQGVSTGRALYWEGIFLLIIAVVTGLFETGALCYPAARPLSKDMGPVRQIPF